MQKENQKLADAFERTKGKAPGFLGSLLGSDGEILEKKLGNHMVRYFFSLFLLCTFCIFLPKFNSLPLKF